MRDKNSIGVDGLYAWDAINGARPLATKAPFWSAMRLHDGRSERAAESIALRHAPYGRSATIAPPRRGTGVFRSSLGPWLSDEGRLEELEDLELTDRDLRQQTLAALFFYVLLAGLSIWAYLQP